MRRTVSVPLRGPPQTSAWRIRNPTRPPTRNRSRRSTRNRPAAGSVTDSLGKTFWEGAPAVSIASSTLLPLYPLRGTWPFPRDRLGATQLYVYPTPLSTDAFISSYIGYFANRYGEQWIFTLDRATGEATLRGGDVDWGRAHAIHDGRVDRPILAPEEAAWLQACWSAARVATSSTSTAHAPGSRRVHHRRLERRDMGS